MTVIARGRGFFFAAVVVGCLLLSDLMTGMYFHDSEDYAQHGWPKLAAFFTAACIVWCMTIQHRDEVLPGTGRGEENRSILRDRDSLFFVPARYWPGILFLLAVGFYFVRG